MNDIQISIIVPVHNTGAYLRDCIRSVGLENRPDWEIILVDDGSGEETAAICRALASEPGVRLLTQPHRGVSAARNLGLAHVRGRYVTFLDSDDLLSADILDRGAAQMETNSLVCWNVTCLLGHRSVPELPLKKPENRYAAVICSRDARYFRACWAKLYDAALIHNENLKFREDLETGEDAVFLLEYLAKAEKVKILEDYGYFYRKQPDSSARKYRENLLEQCRLQYGAIGDFVRTQDVAQQRHIRTALAALCWDMFEKLVDNDEKSGGSRRDAPVWLEACRHRIWSPDVDMTRLPRLCRLGRFLPRKPLCILTAVVRSIRRRRQGHG